MDARASWSISLVVLLAGACSGESTAPPEPRVGPMGDDATAPPFDSGGDPSNADAGTAPAGEDASPPARDAGTAPPLFLDGFFPIAADYQLPASFERWKRRGINTVIRVPHGDGVGEWTNEANRLGLRMIREPRDDISADVRERHLIAWSGQDEPELHRLPPSTVADFRARLHRADPDRPFFINFWGGAVVSSSDPYCNGPGDGSDERCYPSYIDSADWVDGDIYPVNRYTGDLSLVGRMVDKLQRWSGRRPVFAYIETSDFDGDGVGPTARQFRGEIWHAIVHGARGLLYFAVRLSSDGCCSDYDATPTDVADAMTRHHALVTRLAPVLQAPIDPDDLGIAVDEPLEATWRAVPEGRYFIVLNFSDSDRRGRSMHVRHTSARSADVIGESRSVRIAEDGTMVDDFGPYEPHVYRIR